MTEADCQDLFYQEGISEFYAYTADDRRVIMRLSFAQPAQFSVEQPDGTYVQSADMPADLDWSAV